jgi:SAM-dependent methyltransferase
MDMTTTTIVGHSISSRSLIKITLDAARAIASPAVVLVFPETLELWNVTARPGDEHRVETVPRREVSNLARKYRGDLAPDTLYAAKSHGQQLSLFPIDVGLLNSARSGSSGLLSERVTEAMRVMLRSLPDGEAQRAEQLAETSRVVIGALVALMVRDKFELSITGSELFAAAREQYPNYFDWLERLHPIAEDQLSRLLGILGDGVNYEGLDPTVVSEVYERAVVSQSERLRLGIFYTPPDLARQLAIHVPFEELPPEDRVVLDPACGSGTLLVAAHERLQALAPAIWDPDLRHRYLTSRLVGYDTDQFAVEIARLSLLLNALPAGNRWQIEHRDSLHTPMPSPRPTVVISNPPWRDERSRGGMRRQLADDFLQRMLSFVKPGGFIAAILPAAWLTSDVSRHTRELLQESTDVFEVWRFPEGVFGAAKLAPCVIFAQAKQPGDRAWVFRRVLTRKGITRFYETGAAEEQVLAHRRRAARPKVLLRGPLDEAWELVSTLPRLRSVATVQNGPIPEPPVADRGGQGDFELLRRAGDFRAFGEPPRDALVRVRFPQDFHRAGTHDGTIFRKPKLLVSAKRWTVNPWRLKVGLDRRGIIPRESLYMVIPSSKDEDTLYALMAILGSSVASCWIDSYSTKMAVDADLLGDLPLPRPGRIWKDLARAGQGMLWAGASEGLELSFLARAMDELVVQAYELPQDVVQKLERHFRGFDAPEGGQRYRVSDAVETETRSGVETRRFGAVLDVEDDRLRLWVPGVTDEDGSLFQLPERFLGWHCQPDATFEVSTVDSDLRLARYHFQARSYQSFDPMLNQADAM